MGNISDFIKKKREMFLLQMSLDTKKEEIRKLEEKAQMKEQALLKAELMLEEDANRFEQFLQDNDAKCAEAIKKHDIEAKAKQTCAQEIKRLNQKITKIKLDIEKYNETLTECQTYKKFLIDLRPKMWYDKKSKEQKNEKADENEGNQDKVLDQEEMYFNDPQQLFDIFAALEKKNLFLIQNVQETEEQLDEAKQESNEILHQWIKKRKHLENNIEELQKKILEEKKKQKLLVLQGKMKNTRKEGDHQKLINYLASKLELVFKECGFSPEQTPNSIEQLEKIEEHVEMLINSLEDCPESKRRCAEKKAENERRSKIRKEKIKKSEVQYQKRLKMQLERAKRIEEHVKKHQKG